MSDVLDIDDGGEDFQVDEEGYQSVQKLKEKVKKRKDRGFGGDGTAREELQDYEAMAPTNRDLRDLSKDGFCS
ncbi:unnamed protein product [Larinioides sclopetarius]|uniref:Uncharacterized protein n=1 Tax=Larinioides sclopetarius TaxID=280406 RepID=A0AAV2AS50_9ARAC